MTRTLDELKLLIEDLGVEQTIVLENPDYASAAIGLVENRGGGLSYMTMTL